MKFVVEIGTDSERALIEKELSIIGELIKKINAEIKFPADLNQIIVASDLGVKINELENTESYEAIRGFDRGNITALARLASVNDGFAIVLSPLLYTKEHDSKTRFYIIMHELSHLINKKRMPTVPINSIASDIYWRNLYYLYDEYSSDCFALDVSDLMIPEQSNCWIEFEKSIKDGFTNIINDSRYYDLFHSEIQSFRNHNNVDLFIEKVQPSIADLTVCITHLFAWFHTYPQDLDSSNLVKSRFVNQKTFSLMNYYKDRFQESDYKLDDGMQLIIDFMTNFGVKYEQREQGLYCHVLDI